MIVDIWNSFRAMPAWVQIWAMFILFPANMLALAFLAEPGGAIVAGLAIGGMVPNLFLMLWERGFSKAMAFPHLALWTPLVFVLALMLIGAELTPLHYYFIAALLVIDLISLAFDYPDARHWLRGDRAISGRQT